VIEVPAVGGYVTRHIRFLIVGAAISAAMLWPADLLAQRAVPRPPGHTVVAPQHYRPYYYYPYYSPWFYGGFYPYYYSPFYFSFYGAFPYGAYGYGYPPPYYYYGRWDNTGSARLEVSPRNTQVYVDGYYAGVVDDFDGTFQRLNVESGEHELQLFLDGYRSFSQKVLFVRGRTVKITHPMEQLAPGESAGAPPKPDETRRQQQPQPQGQAQPQPGYRGEGQPRSPRPPITVERSGFGSLVLRVRPADATILVDGEVWTAPEGEEQFNIELAEGPHRIEVRKEGFQTYATTVHVRHGEAMRLNVALTSGGGGAVSGF
jgi:hypothetical protein